MSKKLNELLVLVDTLKIYGETNDNVSGITDDSRKVKKGELFVAIKGDTVDAHKFIDDVILKGAKCVVGEIEPHKKWLDKISYIRVVNSRKALGILSAAWYGNPSKKLKVIGVTGTDGKTTTATIIYHILKTAGRKVGLITTVGAKIGNREYDTGFHVTNPEPLELQKFLVKMVDAGCEYAVLEVTSHGLAQDRVTGVDFDTAVLTNITHEHLDYHKTWQDYFELKLKLFRSAKKAIVLNKDDKNFRKISRVKRKEARLITYGLTSKDADIVVKNIIYKSSMMYFDTTFKGRTFKGKTRLRGKYNVENILAAISCTNHLGIQPQGIMKAVGLFEGIKGRFEEVKNDRGIRIVIDFAHTPNSLESVLSLLQKQGKGRLIVVFGSAGERDIEKRKTMPKISVKYADVSVFTAEDPRSEKIEDILHVMSKTAERVGVNKLKRKQYRDLEHDNSQRVFFEIPERGEAISFAINKLANSGDTVAILGKGHEKSMAYGKIEYPWSDQEAVNMALKGKIKRINRK